MMVGLYLAATVVTLLQFLRVKEKRLLPLLALFLFLALAFSREWWDPWQLGFHLAAVAAGLVQLFALSPRHPPLHK